MNASLLTADRRTHLKVMLVACMCSLGAAALAANLAVRKDNRTESLGNSQRLAARSASDRMLVRWSSTVPAGVMRDAVSLYADGL